MAACPNEDRILTAIDGRSNTIDVALERHLDSCVVCRSVIAELSRGEGGDITDDGTFPIWIEKSGAELVRPGLVVDRYQILRQIGAGSMSIVFAARDNKLDREVAIKFMRVMSEDYTWVGKLRDKLLDEARVLAKLSHPNVVAVYDVSVLGQWVYLVMEFVRGGTLQEWLAEQPRTPSQVCEVFRQIARGLASAHEAGVVHRDLKPGNILVGHDGTARITDFGLARAIERINEAQASASSGATSVADVHPDFDTGTDFTTELAGTPAYMAPEVEAGLRATWRSDQFSFWVCFVEAVTGVRPRIDNDYEVHPSMPGGLRSCAARGLSFSPPERFASMHDVVDALEIGTVGKERGGRSGVAVVTVVVLVVLGTLLVVLRVI